MKIEVTQDDIANGRRCDPDCCPVGRAINRAGIVHHGVIGTAVIVEGENHSARPLSLPRVVRNWILDFDGDCPVEPITFELQYLPPRKGKARQSNGKSHASGLAMVARSQARARAPLRAMATSK